MNQNNNQHGKVSVMVQEIALIFVGGDQHLSNWSQGSLNRKEIMPGTENLPCCLRVVRACTLENNLVQPLS